MAIMNINDDIKYSIFGIISGILHLGNIEFVDNGSNYSAIQDPTCWY